MPDGNGSKFPDYKPANVEKLIPYARNSRTHSPAQVDKIAASIKEFGFLNPVITDGENGIVAGHGRILAAQKLGLEEVPTIEASHLTDAQRKAYVIADNRLALDAGWDDEMLRVELKDLDSVDFDLTLTGFDLDELGNLFDTGSLDGDSEENYSRKIEAPIYEPKGEKPKITELIDSKKTETLTEEIDAAYSDDTIDWETSIFLKAAAQRHTVFNFRNIAEFYAHADAHVQDLFERSALVIIDFDRAVEDGFVKLSKEMMEQVGKIKKDDPDA